MTESSGASDTGVRPDTLPLSSPDLAAERLARLRELLPGAFVEGKLVPEKLAELVGVKALSSTPERYGLSYAGRAEALREMLAPSHGTLRPERENSVAWDATENLILEGDNLHVLKLLQSAYAGAVKLIYIDPPYNTGNDFVYPDDFRAGVKHYKELTQQTLSTNAETSGRYHSDWLKMMHPRLALARNLLRDDGVIFVSIDDHEVHNLRLLMDEVFGEENFVGEIIWQHSVQPKGYAGKFSIHHNYLLCFQRSSQFELANLARTDEHNKNYSNPDDDPKGPWRAGDVRNALFRHKLLFDIDTPSGKVIHPPPNGWRWSKETIAEKIRSGEIKFSADETRIIRKIYLQSLEGRTPESIWFGKEVGTTRDAVAELKDLFLGTAPFDTPKPVQMLKRMIELSTLPHEEHLILDFFAGSGTTAQAVLELNRQDGGNRKFILVQFPEPTGRADFPTIADITRERVRRVIQKSNAEDAESAEKQKAELALSADAATSALKKPVPGFRAYRLDDSNFKLWDADAAPADAAALAKQLELIAHNVLDGRGDEDVLAELLLKCGHPGVTLTTAVETREVAGAPVHLLAEGRLTICLSRALTQEVLRGIVALKPQRVLCLDVGFHGNDQLKTNTVLEMKTHGIQFQTV